MPIKPTASNLRPLIAKFVCSWCRSIIGAPPKPSDDATARSDNYGICGTCLEPRLARLDSAEEAGKDERAVGA